MVLRFARKLHLHNRAGKRCLKKPDEYALSVKQPWAALIVLGLKSVEVRNWPTARRGRIFIHAARVSDEPAARLEARSEKAHEHRPSDWRPDRHRRDHRLPDVHEPAKNSSAIRNLHLNDPNWFTGSRLHGFRLAKPEIVPFRSFSGWMRFFPVTP